MSPTADGEKLLLWCEVLVLMNRSLLPEGRSSNSSCPGWEGSATILLSRFSIQEANKSSRDGRLQPIDLSETEPMTEEHALILGCKEGAEDGLHDGCRSAPAFVLGSWNRCRWSGGLRHAFIGRTGWFPGSLFSTCRWSRARGGKRACHGAETGWLCWRFQMNPHAGKWSGGPCCLHHLQTCWLRWQIAGGPGVGRDGFKLKSSWPQSSDV